MTRSSFLQFHHLLLRNKDPHHHCLRKNYHHHHHTTTNAPLVRPQGRGTASTPVAPPQKDQDSWETLLRLSFISSSTVSLVVPPVSSLWQKPWSRKRLMQHWLGPTATAFVVGTAALLLWRVEKTPSSTSPTIITTTMCTDEGSQTTPDDMEPQEVFKHIPPLSPSPPSRPLPYWENGLLYDDPKNDEPTSCSFCNLYRQGPCRPYWRPFELCIKNNKQSLPEDQQDDASDHQPPETNHEHACRAISERFMMECLSEYASLYTLIDTQTWQDELFDTIEWTERQTAFQNLWSMMMDIDDKDEEEKRNGSIHHQDAIRWRVYKLLASQPLYQHVHDCYKWSESIHVNWKEWHQYMTLMKLEMPQDHVVASSSSESAAETTSATTTSTNTMIPTTASTASSTVTTTTTASIPTMEHEHHRLRPVWWSTGPALPRQGMVEVIDFLSSMSSSSSLPSTNLTKTSPSTTTTLSTSFLIPKPLVHAQTHQSKDDAGSYKNNMATASSSSSSDPMMGDPNHVDDFLTSNQSHRNQKKDGVGFWQSLKYQNPILIPITVMIPKQMLIQNNQNKQKKKKQKQRQTKHNDETKSNQHHSRDRVVTAPSQLQYAYCRDANTGVVLGHYYNHSNEFAISNSDDTMDNPNHDGLGNSESNQKSLNNEVNDDDHDTDSSQTKQTSRNDEDGNQQGDELKMAEMVVYIVPDQTSSIQLFGAYMSNDTYDFMESPPISLVDYDTYSCDATINTISTSNSDDDDDVDHDGRDKPRRLHNQQWHELMDQYKILHNFAQHQTFIMSSSPTTSANNLLESSTTTNERKK